MSNEHPHISELPSIIISIELHVEPVQSIFVYYYERFSLVFLAVLPPQFLSSRFQVQKISFPLLPLHS